VHPDRYHEEKPFLVSPVPIVCVLYASQNAPKLPARGLSSRSEP